MAYVNRSYNQDAGLKRYRRGTALRRRGMMGFGSLGDDACTPYGGTMQPDGTCSVAIAGPGSNLPIETTTTGSGGGGSSGTPWYASLLQGFANVTTPAGQPMPVPVQSGISTTTLVIGGVVLVGIALLLKSRK